MSHALVVNYEQEGCRHVTAAASGAVKTVARCNAQDRCSALIGQFVVTICMTTVYTFVLYAETTPTPACPQRPLMAAARQHSLQCMCLGCRTLQRAMCCSSW